MEVLQNSQKFRVFVARAYRTHRSSGQVQKMLYPYRGYCGTGRTELTQVPDTGMNVIQNSKKFRVRVREYYRTHRSSGYCGTGVQNSQKSRAGIKMLYPYLGYCGHRRTEVPGTGMNVLQNLHKFFVGKYPGKIPRVWFCTYPTEHNLGMIH